MSKHRKWQVVGHLLESDRPNRITIVIADIFGRPFDADKTEALVGAAPELFGLLTEARATLEMWKDVAPAIGLCADIDKVLAKAKGEPT